MQIGPDLLDTSQATLGKFDFDFAVFVGIELFPVVLKNLQDLELLIWVKLADLFFQIICFLQREHWRLV